MLTVLFLLLFVSLADGIYRLRGALPTSISFFDVSLIALAVFRLSRLFVYDKITQFIRDIFLRKREVVARDGTILVERTAYQDGPARAISDIFNCPWCIGIWFSPVVLFFYFTAAWSWYAILALAVSGAAAFVQLLTNMVGWRAEHLKLKAVHEYREADAANKHC